jgi:hypothetical protein
LAAPTPKLGSKIGDRAGLGLHKHVETLAIEYGIASHQELQGSASVQIDERDVVHVTGPGPRHLAMLRTGYNDTQSHSQL